MNHGPIEGWCTLDLAGPRNRFTRINFEYSEPESVRKTVNIHAKKSLGAIAILRRFNSEPLLGLPMDIFANASLLDGTLDEYIGETTRRKVASVDKAMRSTPGFHAWTKLPAHCFSSRVFR